jgi:hypothetical protein
MRYKHVILIIISLPFLSFLEYNGKILSGKPKVVHNSWVHVNPNPLQPDVPVYELRLTKNEIYTIHNHSTAPEITSTLIALAPTLEVAFINPFSHQIYLQGALFVSTSFYSFKLLNDEVKEIRIPSDDGTTHSVKASCIILCKSNRPGESPPLTFDLGQKCYTLNPGTQPFYMLILPDDFKSILLSHISIDNNNPVYKAKTNVTLKMSFLLDPQEQNISDIKVEDKTITLRF